MKHINVLEDALIVGGITISLAQIQTILGIVIMSFQIVLILVKASTKIYQSIKNKKIDDIGHIVDETREQIDKLSSDKDGRK